MQNRVEYQVFITARNKRVPIFNDGRFSKPYLEKLTNNTKSFLNRVKNVNANRQDVTEIHWVHAWDRPQTPRGDGVSPEAGCNEAPTNGDPIRSEVLQ